MTRPARFCAPQLMKLSLASALLLRTLGPYVLPSAASSSTHLAAGGPGMLLPQGTLREHSSRSVRRQ